MNTSKERIEGDIRKISKLGQRTLYEKIVYALDVLVPEDEAEEIFVPMDSFLQQVQYGRLRKWRVLKNSYKDLPEYLANHVNYDEPYRVYLEKRAFLGPLDLSSQFIKRCDELTLALLLFTALITPFETAY